MKNNTRLEIEKEKEEERNKDTQNDSAPFRQLKQRVSVPPLRENGEKNRKIKKGKKQKEIKMQKPILNKLKRERERERVHQPAV